MDRILIDDSVIDEWIVSLDLDQSPAITLLDPKKVIKLLDKEPQEYEIYTDEYQVIPSVSTSSERMYEKYKGDMITNWLISQSPFIEDQIKFTTFNNYLYLIRTGIRNIITKSNSPDLKILSWQYGVPIDYESLGTVSEMNSERYWLELRRLMKNHTVFGINVDQKYQLFLLKYLVYLWFIDDELANFISKIKVRLNLDDNYPSIIICPIYGTTFAEIVSVKLQYYLERFNYLSSPKPLFSDFVKVNNLIYFLNSKLKFFK